MIMRHAKAPQYEETIRNRRIPFVHPHPERFCRKHARELQSFSNDQRKRFGRITLDRRIS